MTALVALVALVALAALLLRPRDRDARGRLRTVGGHEVVSEGTHDHAPGQRADHWDDDVQACARDHAVGPQAVAERDQDRVALGSAHAIERHEQVGALASRTELADRPEPGRSRRSVAGDDELAWLGCVRVEDHRLVAHGRDRDDLPDAGRAGGARELECAVGPLGGGDPPIDAAAALDDATFSPAAR